MRHPVYIYFLLYLESERRNLFCIYSMYFLLLFIKGENRIIIVFLLHIFCRFLHKGDVEEGREPKIHFKMFFHSFWIPGEIEREILYSSERMEKNTAYCTIHFNNMDSKRMQLSMSYSDGVCYGEGYSIVHKQFTTIDHCLFTCCDWGSVGFAFTCSETCTHPFQGE